VKVIDGGKNKQNNVEFIDDFQEIRIRKRNEKIDVSSKDISLRDAALMMGAFLETFTENKQVCKDEETMYLARAQFLVYLMEILNVDFNDIFYSAVAEAYQDGLNENQAPE